MTGHSKEPWRVQHPHAGMRGWEIADSSGLNQVSQDVTEANARRIVACVNACVGVSNGELAMTTMSVVLARMNEAEQQRDDLRDAIGLAITIIDELTKDENLSGHMKRTLNGLAEGLRVRATINKTTGETK